MGDLTAEDRAALLAASMACENAKAALWRAYAKLLDVEDRLGKRAKNDEGNLLTDRLVDTWCGAAHCYVLMDMAMTDRRCVEWE